MITYPNPEENPAGQSSRLAEDPPPLPPRRPTAPESPRRHPLKSFGLANFKAFGPNAQTIPLKPITLLFGPNSSGKSSILHFLLWMKAVVEGKGLDVYFPIPGSSTVDLGGFKQLRHGDDPGTEVSVALEFDLTDTDGRVRHMQSVSTFAACPPPSDYAALLKAKVVERFADILTRHSFESLVAKTYAVENSVVEPVLRSLLTDEYGKFTVDRLLADCSEGNGELTTPWRELRRINAPKLHKFHPLTVLLEEVEPSHSIPTPEEFSREELLAELKALTLSVFHELKLQPLPPAEVKPSLVRFELSERGKPVLIVNRDEANVMRVQRLELDWLISFHDGHGVEVLPEEGLSTARQAESELVFEDRTTWLPGALLYLQQAESPQAQAAQDRLKELLEGTSVFPGLLPLCRRAGETLCGGLTYLGPLRAYPQRNVTIADLPQTNDPEGLFAWRLLYELKDVREGVNLWLDQPILPSRFEVITDIRVGLRQAGQKFAGELHRRISLKKDEFSNLWEHFQGGHPDHDPLNETYEWFSGWDDLKWMEDATELARTTLESQASGIVYLRDKRSGKHVTCRDIGVGMSQMIPVLTVAKAARGEFIAIEESETHIHPALQAELGDVFIESALQRGNTFLLETHSEHLILRILRRIRETTAGENGDRPPLTPADVAVLYVEPGEDGSKVIEIPIGPDGDFDRPWPNGFFAERGKELF